MLELKDVSKFYYSNGIIASGFTKINLKLRMGEFVVITGESGSGKTTLLNVISGLDSYEEGEMYVDGKETSHYTEKDFEDYRRKYIANIFQNFNLVNSYTVYQNVELVLLLNGYKKKDIKKKVLDMIDQVGLTKFKNTKVSKLSGGQKQRVAIARAMVKETPIIVADEPTGNLDVESAKEAIEILKKVSKDKLVIIVTHNIEQMEQYATRIIKMHDGRIVENNEVKKVEDNIEVKTSKYNKITRANKYRLGIRNTFNIFSKFALLFVVFLFITLAVFAEYASFKNEEYELSQQAHNYYFKDTSPNRILITKKDKTEFSSEDYEKIKSISNINYIVENDYLIDKRIKLYQGDFLFGIGLKGYFNDIKKFDGNLDKGRMPENDNEIILTTDKNYISIDDYLNKTFNVSTTDSYNMGNSQDEVTIVGIKYTDAATHSYDFDFQIYATSKMIEKLKIPMNISISTIKYLFNGKYTDIANYQLVSSKNVEKGKAIVNDDLKYQLIRGSIKNKPITIFVNNFFYNEELNLKISRTYTKLNFKKVTGYDEYQDIICINEEDYKYLFDKPSYQSSVYVKDTEDIDETLQELENMGIEAKKITDFALQDNSQTIQVEKIIKTIVTIILIIILFFISYFIIRIILKSRNTYYTTLRMLGAGLKSVKRILDIELFINSNIAYFTVVIFIWLTKLNIINFEYIRNLAQYIQLPEYLLMYVILVLMSRLVSRRFSRKLFKNSTIDTYNEEV